MTNAVDRLGGFSDFEGHLWLNTAHQGAMPIAAAAAANAAAANKLAPHLLTNDLFETAPENLRAAYARVLDVPSDEVVLSNSASYGLHLLARCVPLEPGDEILVMQCDFPSDILPWLWAQKERGVTVRQIDCKGPVITSSELKSAFSPNTRVFCTTWVNSFTGYSLDLASIGAACRDRDVLFIANLSQGLGSLPLENLVSVDAAVSVGFKWLCGPYGSGLLWVKPELRKRLRPAKAYWLSMMSTDELGRSDLTVDLRDDRSARAFDIFGTANFLNSAAMTAALEHVFSIGLRAIHEHDAALVDAFVEGLDRHLYDLDSPEAGPSRSSLIYISHRDRGRNGEIWRRLDEKGVHIARRAGSLRISPHLYNSRSDVERCLELLHELARTP